MARSMKKLTGFLLVVCMIVSLFAGATTAFAAKSFVDVPDSHWAKQYVDFVVDKGYFAGTGADKFSPDGIMTRAMFVQVISKVEGVTLDNSVDSGFKDVPSGKYYTGAVKWAADNKIVTGKSDGVFAPNDPITRQEICVMMDKYIQYHDKNNDTKYLDREDDVVFKDASDIASWAKESVEKCVSYGLIKGYPDGKFLPKNKATRAEVAVMIYKLALYIEPEEPEPEAEFKAKYEFKSSTSGKELPESVSKLLPVDSKSYKAGETVKAQDPAETVVAVEDGAWSFEGYDAKEKKVEKADVVFSGKWAFTKTDSKEYTVTYKFVSGTKDVELPSQVNAFLPKDDKTYVAGETVKAIDPSIKEYATLQGTWKFKGYDKTEVKVDHENVVFTGTWERDSVIPATYRVKYVFKAADGTDVPAQVNAVKPVDVRVVQDGTEVKPLDPSKKTVTAGDDIWEFTTYDKDSIKVNGADATFTGVWKKVSAATKYKVTYKNQINATVAVPDAVKKELDSRLPAAKEYDDGTRVSLTTPVQSTYASKEGTWMFVSFGDLGQTLSRTVTLNGADEEVIWVWTLIPNRYYSVKYEYDYTGVKATDRAAIRQTLQTDSVHYYTGDEATILEPKSLKVKDSNRTGEYVFQGYTGYEDEKTVEIEDADVTLTGTWKFCEYRTVEYQYVTEDGSEFAKDVKDAIKKTVPTDSTKYVEGDTVEVLAPNGAEEFKSEAANARYIYTGVEDPEGAKVKDGKFTMPAGDGKLVIKGIWEKTNQYAVKYEFVEADGTKITDKKTLTALGLPEIELVDNGKTVTPKAVTAKEVNYGGYDWVWKGYEGEQIRTVKDADVVYVGKWEKTKTYTATYSFKPENAADTLPAQVGQLYADKFAEGTSGLKDKTEFTPAAIDEKYTTDEGIWSFKGWEPAKQKVEGKDISFVGVWKLEKKTK